MTPMPLPIAVQVCFPHGGATVNTLRRAIRAGVIGADASTVERVYGHHRMPE